jgi:hypothetical protein
VRFTSAAQTSLHALLIMAEVDDAEGFGDELLHVAAVTTQTWLPQGPDLDPANGRRSPCEEDELRERLDQDRVLYNSADLSPALSLLESNGEAGYDTGALPGLPYVLHRPIPDNWGGPSRLQPHPPRLVMIKRLRQA